MAQKNESKVLIGGNVYTLSGDESEEYLQHVALYINKKMQEVQNSENGKKLNTRLQSVLLAINIADDYFKVKTSLDEKERQIEELKKETDRLKNELDDYIDLFEHDDL
ncbi:cell division protein ZapA [Vallitaleaceae bacterium 9-2]